LLKRKSLIDLTWWTQRGFSTP